MGHTNSVDLTIVPPPLIRPRLIVGLGNPGRRYAGTRHNIGFMTVEALGRHLKAGSWREDRLAAQTEARTEGGPLLLLKPLTFMNLSGQAVRAAAARLSIPPARVLVVSDDLDLPFGRLRLRPGGSTGGHNGLRSIEADLGTREFPRLRLGIGRPLQGDPIDWVLAPFDAQEVSCLPLITEAAREMLMATLTEGLLAAMNRYNGRGSVLADDGSAATPGHEVRGAG